jgi:hypothetical protein
MSSIQPGYFDCGKLLEVKAKVEEIFQGGVIGAEYIPDVEPALAILNNQTATFEVLTNPEKDREVKVYWLDDCDDEDPTECTDQCTIDGDPIGDNCVNYTLGECFEKTLSVTEELFRTSLHTKEEVVARALLKKMKLMDEFWAAKALAFLNASGGVNTFSDGQYAIVGGNTYVPAAAWNPDIFGYIDTALWMNKLGGNVKMLSGTLLKQYMWKIGMETSDPTGASAQAKMTSFGVPYFDRRMDTILGEKAVILFDPNATALVTKARHEAYGEAGRIVQTPTGPQRWYTMPSMNLPGITYDIAYQELCSGDDIKHTWKLKTRGDLFLNPLGCSNDRTGVLKFVCGNAPS